MGKLKVVFFDSDHSYFSIDEDLIVNGRISFKNKKDPSNMGIRKLKSVSTFYSDYFPEYESDYWLTYKGLQFANQEVFNEVKSANFKGIGAPHPELFFPMLFDRIDHDVFHEKKQMFEDFWDFKRTNSGFLGTKFHLAKEEESRINGYIINPFTDEKFKLIEHTKTFDNESIVYNLYDLVDGAYYELLLFDLEAGVAGQVDELFVKTIKKKRYIWINDHKGLCVETPIPTNDGWKRMGDLVVGDKVFDGNGKITTVKVVSDLHYNPCFKVKFDTNDSIICDHEHKWVVETRINHDNYKNIEVTTDELFKLFNNGDMIRIPCVGIDTKEIKLPIDPYVLGVWLGDGNRCCGAITNETDTVWNEIKSRGYEIGKNLNEKSSRSITRTVFGLEHHLRKLKLLKNKHIPDIYLRSSKSQRLDLLRGFMDADGTFNRGRKRCVMHTTGKWQADALSTLISSLGYKPTTIPINVVGFGLKKIGYAISFSPDENPFLARNADYLSIIDKIRSKSRIRSKYRYIKSIESIETVPTKCIAVDSSDHTYLAGYNFIKTHNTNEKKPETSAMTKAYPPLNQLDNCKHNHYSMQLSSYAHILQRAGFTVQDLAYTFYKDYDPNSYEMVKVEYFSSICENIFKK